MGCSGEKTKEEFPDINRGFPICRLSIPITNEIDSIISFDSKHIILGGKDELKICDLGTQEISLISNEHQGRINCLIKLPNGNIASGGQDSKIKIWDVNKKICLYTLEGHSSIIWDIKYLQKNKLISASDDNSCKLWNLDSKTNEIIFKGRRHISCVAILKNNKILFAEGKNLILYNLKTKDQESCLDIKVWTLKVLKNGQVAAGLGNGLLYILEITDEINIKTQFGRGHKTTINTIIELENEKLITSSDENDLILWDRNEPDSIYEIKGHKDVITSLCLIEKNKFASVSRDNTLKIWE